MHHPLLHVFSSVLRCGSVHLNASQAAGSQGWNFSLSFSFYSILPFSRLQIHTGSVGWSHRRQGAS